MWRRNARGRGRELPAAGSLPCGLTGISPLPEAFRRAGHCLGRLPQLHLHDHPSGFLRTRSSTPSPLSATGPSRPAAGPVPRPRLRRRRGDSGAARDSSMRTHVRSDSAVTPRSAAIAGYVRMAPAAPIRRDGVLPGLLRIRRLASHLLHPCLDHQDPLSGCPLQRISLGSRWRSPADRAPGPWRQPVRLARQAVKTGSIKAQRASETSLR